MVLLEALYNLQSCRFHDHKNKPSVRVGLIPIPELNFITQASQNEFSSLFFLSFFFPFFFY